MDFQGDQLDNVERGLNQMGTDLKTAEIQLDEMETSICRKSGCSRHSVDKSDDTNAVQKLPGEGTNLETEQSQSSSGGGGMQIARKTNDAKEDEIEENLDMTQRSLENLRTIAIGMGDVIDRQNDQIDRLNLKTQENNLRVSEANKQTEALLKK